MITLEDVFNAYFDCRKKKRRTIAQLEFELNYEFNLSKLYEDIVNGKYKIGTSICFVVDEPVKREVFAASFRDRIVHHLIVNKINKFIEKELINDCYSCRKGKGTLFGIKRMAKFVRSSSSCFTKEDWVLKLDIQGFFMGLKKDVMYNKVHSVIWKAFLNKNLDEQDFDILSSLSKQVIFHDPTKDFFRNCAISKWETLPKHKSLFGLDGKTGMPIGNLTSQIFANLYMSELDHFIKSDLGFRYYGRYVDDFVLIHHDKSLLVKTFFVLRSLLKKQLGLVLHSKKVYLQKVRNGFSFIGARIYLGYILPGKRLMRNFSSFFRSFLQCKGFNFDLTFSKFCSYFGFIMQFKSYRIQSDIIGYSLSI